MRGEAGAWTAGAALVSLGLGLPLVFGSALYTKERDDRFCVSCHLHEEKFTRFQARPTATDLASAHHASRQGVRCIDCHGGADPAMRLRVWAVAGFDTVKFLVGRYGEPRGMRLRLRDAECRQCHDPIVKVSLEQEEAQEGRGDTFHAIIEHRSVKIACVACHTSHTSGQKRLAFIERKTVLPICRNCHERMGEEVGG
ncbi:MAG TPA: cytochrome c3 family protein [Methylomirabilota bacterium]|nr:cytochrome c3 family protein [Methylomirabilota bacterium]